MNKIRNPFVGNEGYSCFACCPDNPHGLQMEFFEDGDQVVSHWSPRPWFEGYTGVLHGGIQATLMDEIASWCIFVRRNTGGATQSINATYLKPVYTGKGSVTLRSKIGAVEGNLVTVDIQIYDGDDVLCTEGQVTYFTYPERLAKRRLAYPGREAFRSNDES
jgi:uncharacterized protein (TIGR00369 family)